MGTRSWSKGRLYRIKNRLDIRPPISYARAMDCSIPSRQRFNSQFHPLRLLVPALLLVMVCAVPLQLEGQAGEWHAGLWGQQYGRCPG